MLPIRLLVCSVLALIAALHGYWGAGGIWPGRDQHDLAAKVVGPGELPPPAACFGVAAALAGAAGTVLLSPRSRRARTGAVAVAGVLLLRGAGGYGFPRTGRSFDRLNRRVYSPLCLGLGLLTALSLRRQQ